MSSTPLVKFLVVDDLEENLLAIEGLLRREGLELLKAKSGHAALEILLENDVALAILDVQMPEMDGFELAELMRGSSRTSHIPIIFLTAGSFDDRRRFRGYEAGAVDFLFKPIEPTVLKSKADVFYDLYCQRQEMVRQRDALRAANDENTRLYNEILHLNQSLEERVQDRTKQLLEANEQLQGFTLSIAHDFRQHIRNINVNAEILLMESEESLGEARENAERIMQVALLMNRMTDDLLTYARMRTVSVRATEIDLSELATEIAASYQRTYPGSRYQIEPSLSAWGDRTMVRIVLENLLDNAFKYSQNAPEPFIEFGRDEEAFFVRDNGIGIDMAYADKLFLPFERLLAPREFPGTGMGLANVKRIVERHEGRVWVDSKTGEGAVVHFSLGPIGQCEGGSGENGRT